MTESEYVLACDLLRIREAQDLLSHVTADEVPEVTLKAIQAQLRVLEAVLSESVESVVVED